MPCATNVCCKICTHYYKAAFFKCCNMVTFILLLTTHAVVVEAMAATFTFDTDRASDTHALLTSINDMSAE